MFSIINYIMSIVNFIHTQESFESLLTNLPNTIHVKQQDSLALLFTSTQPVGVGHTGPNNGQYELEDSCKSVIIDKTNNKIIGTQYNNIIYNDDAINFLREKSWSDVVVSNCHEGTLMLVYYHDDKWHVSTRRCLDANQSYWVKNRSYGELFDDARRFNYDDLDKELCYHFILVHHLNKNIVALGPNEKKLYHVMTTRKYTLEEINYVIKDADYDVGVNFNSLDHLLYVLNNISVTNEAQQLVMTEGYIVKYYNKLDNSFTVLKIQSGIYQKLALIKPNNSNIDQIFLELYQKNKLVEFMPYFTNYGKQILHRINTSFRQISSEVFNVYHMTRSKKNEELYGRLPGVYKKVLYGLHGLFISENIKNNNKNMSINVHVVYNYLKNILEPYELRQLFQERMTMLENNSGLEFINPNCMATMTQCALMFA